MGNLRAGNFSGLTDLSVIKIPLEVAYALASLAQPKHRREIDSTQPDRVMDKIYGDKLHTDTISAMLNLQH